MTPITRKMFNAATILGCLTSLKVYGLSMFQICNEYVENNLLIAPPHDMIIPTVVKPSIRFTGIAEMIFAIANDVPKKKMSEMKYHQSNDSPQIKPHEAIAYLFLVTFDKILAPMKSTGQMM